MNWRLAMLRFKFHFKARRYGYYPPRYWTQAELDEIMEWARIRSAEIRQWADRGDALGQSPARQPHTPD
jgi:hypothetical protein